LSEFTDAAGAARLGMAAHLRAVTAARRAETDLAVLDANRLHAAARDLAVSAPAFAPAFGAYCAGQPVVPLTADGSAALPDCEPTRDLARLIGYWTEHPSAPAGLPTGLEPDLIAAATDTSAWEWLRNSSVSSAAEGDRPPQRLDPVFGLVRLIEQRPASSPWRSTTFFGDDEMAEAGNKLNSTDDARGPGDPGLAVAIGMDAATGPVGSRNPPAVRRSRRWWGDPRRREALAVPVVRRRHRPAAADARVGGRHPGRHADGRAVTTVEHADRAVTSVEYADRGRSPYPPHWGPPSDAENRRVGWALSHIRQDTAARNTRRLATLHRRRYDPWEQDTVA
jgi:hypothetical protein